MNAQLPTSAPPASGLLTTPEAAAYLRLSRRSMERLVAGRQVPVVHIGRRVLLRQADLDAFITKHLEQPVRVNRHRALAIHK